MNVKFSIFLIIKFLKNKTEFGEIRTLACWNVLKLVVSSCEVYCKEILLESNDFEFKFEKNVKNF